VRTASNPAASSVAVLPFENVGGDTATQYFADGMTDEMIGALAKVNGLRVPGRTSVFALRGRNLNPRAIGDTLGVATLLEGSVRRAGNRIRVGAQLVSVADNAVLWSDEYDRELKDVFAVQDEIARAIVASLRVRLSGADTGALVRRPTDDLTAYELYLRGRASWSTRSPAGLERAISSFQQALARDPDFAPAHAGLATAYIVQPLYENTDPSAAWAKARQAAERALALDSTLADAHAALGYGLMIYAWDWASAERELRRSISLSPSYATGHQWYGDFLGGRGRLEEALREVQAALALDPLSLVMRMDVAWKLYALRRYDAAAAELRRVLATDPSRHSAHALLGAVYLQQGLAPRAVEELRRSVELQGRGGYAQDVATLAYAQARAGDERGARRLLRDLTDRARREYIHPSALAIAHTGLGDADEAFRWLDRAIQGHDARLAETVLFAPLLDPLRADPRFSRVRVRMGLPP
jgi:TolB-like protein/Tfp pilus assembly protein PilF